MHRSLKPSETLDPYYGPTVGLSFSLGIKCGVPLLKTGVLLTIIFLKGGLGGLFLDRIGHGSKVGTL